MNREEVSLKIPMSSGIKATRRRIRTEIRQLNPWTIALRGTVIFVATSMLFMFTTIGYTVYNTDQWTAIVVSGASYILAFALMSIAVSRGVQPIFDWPTLFMNSVHIGMKSSYTDNTNEVTIGGEIHWLESIIYIVVLFAASIFGNGLARAVVGDNTYALIAKNIPLHSTAAKAFFIEFAIQAGVYIGTQQILFHGSNLEWVALIIGIFWIGGQAIGRSISGSCFNTMYWLGLSVIGTGIKERFDPITSTLVPVVWFDDNSWVYPVSSVVALIAAIVTGFAVSFVKQQAQKYDGMKSNSSRHDAEKSGGVFSALDDERDEE